MWGLSRLLPSPVPRHLPGVPGTAPARRRPASRQLATDRERGAARRGRERRQERRRPDAPANDTPAVNESSTFPGRLQRWTGHAGDWAGEREPGAGPWLPAWTARQLERSCGGVNSGIDTAGWPQAQLGARRAQQGARHSAVHRQNACLNSVCAAVKLQKSALRQSSWLLECRHILG